MKTFLFILIAFIGLCSCKETFDAYIGFPLQPDLKENNYEPGLNIIGVIRPDFNDTVNNSFIHIQEVAPAINNYPDFTSDSMIVSEALVFITDQMGEEYEFSYTSHDSLFESILYRPNSDFYPESGSQLSISCSFKDLPILTSETIIPNKPEIIESTISQSNQTLYFEIAADTTAFLYEIYVFNQKQNIGYARFIPSFIETTIAEIKLTENTTTRIEVYGYDYNLANYYLTSNTSLNFNKYRKTFGNVENGYGVFGSLNFVHFPID